MADRNKNSVYEVNGRYVQGGTTEISGNFVEYWERISFPKSDDDKLYTIEDVYDGRPDKLAFVIYGDSRLWWLICQYNNIIDVVDEFVEGKEIELPTKDRVLNDFLVSDTGGVESTRIIPDNSKSVV